MKLILLWLLFALCLCKVVESSSSSSIASSSNVVRTTDNCEPCNTTESGNNNKVLNKKKRFKSKGKIQKKKSSLLKLPSSQTTLFIKYHQHIDACFDVACSISQLIVSRKILNIDIKENLKAYQISKYIFSLYILLSKVLLMLLSRLVERENDCSEIITPLGQGQSQFNIFSMVSTSNNENNSTSTMTVKEFDMLELRKLGDGITMELLTGIVSGYFFNYRSSLLLVPLSGIISKIKSPTIKYYIYKSLLGRSLLKKIYKSPIRPIPGGIQNFLGRWSDTWSRDNNKATEHKNSNITSAS
jgi:hypothetical protein